MPRLTPIILPHTLRKSIERRGFYLRKSEVGMDPSTYTNGGSDKPRYIDFPSLKHGTVGADSKQALNRWSTSHSRGFLPFLNLL